MDFFVGVHQPSDAARVPRAFVSVNRIRYRKSPFPVREWIMDSGAFTTVNKFCGYPEEPAVYAAQIRRWASNGDLLAAVSQDYMCEPFVLARTGLTIADHQRLTIERYDALLEAGTAGVYVMPVLQGYAPVDYVSHIRQYGARLAHGAWVGVGSVCKRNGTPSAIECVLLAIKAERPDLRLHGFGVKITSLGSQLVRDLLHSADSMAWSYAARMTGGDGNDIRNGIRYARRVETMATQESFFGINQFGPVYMARTTSGADTFHVCPSGQTQRPSSLVARLPDKQARDMGKAGQLKNTRLRMAPAHCFDGGRSV